MAWVSISVNASGWCVVVYVELLLVNRPLILTGNIVYNNNNMHNRNECSSFTAEEIYFTQISHLRMPI